MLNPELENKKIESRKIARKFHKIGMEIGLKSNPPENSYKFPTQEEILEQKKKLEPMFESSVSFSWARTSLLGENYSITHIHLSNKTLLYDDIYNLKKIYIDSYHYPGNKNDY